MSAEDNSEAWKRVQDFHTGSWRGVARRVNVDGVLRRARLEKESKRYVSDCDTDESIPTVYDEIRYDANDIIEKREGRDFCGDLDASYSVDYRDDDAEFTTELIYALGSNERVKLRIGYDALNYLSHITILDEVRLGSTDETAAGARRAIEPTDLWSLAGDWQGDATVRRRFGKLAVAKHDLCINTDGDRLHRYLTIADISGTTVHEDEAFGLVVPGASEEIDLVVFDSGSALIHLQFAGIYALCPLNIGSASFHVEAGLFVDELPDTPNAQFPISIRSTEDEDSNLEQAPRIIGLAGGSTSSDPTNENNKKDALRHLARAIRLYDAEGQLASVTTSYHRRGDRRG